jgi:DNA-binding CsgD family transcriptional regulator
MGLCLPVDPLPHAVLGEWLRELVGESIPHRAALMLRGSAHSLGFSIDERLFFDLPESYLAAISNAHGQIRSPLLGKWMRTREMQYFDAGEGSERTDPRWLRNFEAHGLRNCALFGQVAPSSDRVILLALYDLPGGRPAEDRCAGAEQMTRAELEVLRWVRLGKTNHEIGMILGRSRFTVKTHIQRMLAKTGLDNRTQLSDFAQQNGIAAR